MTSKQIICPKCKTAIEVDEDVYAALLSQVRNKEFEDAVNKREQEIRKTISAENEAKAARKQSEHNAALANKDVELSNKDNEIALLRKEIDGLSAEKAVEYNKQLALKDQEIAKLMEKIDSLLEGQRMAIENAEAKKDSEISKLKEQLKSLSETQRLTHQNELAQKDKEIADLKSCLEQGENLTKIAVLEEHQRCQETIAGKDREIADLQSKMDQQENTAALTLASTREQYEAQLKMKDEQVAQYRDFKAKQSTKAIGENLEVWCSNQFNAARMTSYPFAYFDKDNDIVDHTKGDFVFRDYASFEDKQSGTEYISIMFEMKNEAENTEKKHRNDEFFKKLDEDRRKKGCEYAVLVSTLEADSDFYNRGIVDVSYIYPKMFVVRPEFFMAIIGILSTSAKEKVALRQELQIVRNQSIDVTNFESRWIDFQEAFGKNVSLYRNQFDEAMKRIDDAIDMLQKIKDTFRRSDRNLRLANDKAQEMSIRKLTYKNPTMQAMFAKARRASGAATQIEASDFTEGTTDGSIDEFTDDAGY